MIQLPEDRRPPLTPQLALRVAILGSFALAIFAIIFFRLWVLQVLSGDQYLAQARVNQVRNINVPAPRGQIVDRSGNILVDSQQAIAVQISPPDLPVRLTPLDITRPPRKDVALFTRLAHVLSMPTARQPCKVPGYGTSRLSPIACLVAQGIAQVPYANVTVAKAVPTQILYYLEERQDQFPAVNIETVWERTYPLHDLAAQLFGTIGPINQAELKDVRFKGLSQQDTVGQSGLEWSYNRYVQGTDGAEQVQVDSLGHFTSYLKRVPPVPGHTLKLSLDINMQRIGQQALQQSIASNYPSDAGAFVAMNPVDGQIYAMGSLPTFDPNVFTKPITQSQYDSMFGSSSNYPLIDRAIQSAGPTGSTFKPITATAALQSGAWSVDESFDDTGQFCEGTLCRRNAGGAAYGILNLVNAIRVSSDVFFYNLGALLNSQASTGGELQQWARGYGIGRKTGVDLGGEVSGNLPTPSWRAHINQLEAQCDAKRHLQPGGCGIADGTNRPWSQGDNVNLAVGQGDVQVTPLQLAVAYSAIANGGSVVRPHVGLEVEAPNGTVLQKIDPAPARHLNINSTYLDTIREGLHEAAQSPGGTSYDVMGTFPMPVFGKTGTAQYNGQQDYAWYACFVPPTATTRPIVIVVKVEQGGFGAIAAAPVARELLSQWFFGKRGQYVAGTSRTL